MSKRPRRNLDPTLKVKVALAAVRGEKALAEPARQYDVHPNLINQWRARRLEGAIDVFGSICLQAGVPHARINAAIVAAPAAVAAYDAPPTDI